MPDPKSRTSRALGAAIRVIAGLVIGAVIAEVAFRARDGGAFPHLNLYTPDAELGVRLLPGESMKLAFGGNAPTTVRVNASGYRGPDWPAPGADEVLVVGDSQVFGLGVEEGETFSARLGGLLGGAQVINAGVPTYGPPEYERVVAELVEKRRPKRVVYVVNLSNDLFEADRPNRERHAVWDGWAVRRETAPSRVASFPGREALFRKSHAVFALRRWWYRRGGPTEAFSAPSEGTFRDIGAAAARAAEERLAAREDTRRLLKLQEAKVAVANAALGRAQHGFLELVSDEHIKTDTQARGAEGYISWDPLKASFAQPGDIVGSEDYAEWSRPLYATVDMILQGAEVRKRIEKVLRDKARGSEKDAARIAPILSGVDEAQRRADAVRAEAAPRIRAWSPLAPAIKRAKAICDAAGARLFVVALPIDVQVSKDEWAKYGVPPVDLEPARVLVDDLVDSVEDAGATAIDLTEPLRAAEPGAFLNRDIHLSSKGHEAVARALAAALSAPPRPTLAEPRAGRPLGRVPPTPLAAARERREVTVPGSTAAGCETYIVDEWLTLRCTDQGVDKAPPLGVRVNAAPLGESVIYRDGKSVVVQVAVLRDQVSVVDFRWADRGRRLDTTWDKGKVTVSFHPLAADETAKVPGVPRPSDAVCAAVTQAKRGKCEELPVVDNPACFATYKDDAEATVACLLGDRGAAPACPRGAAPVGVFQRCRPLCSKEAPCKAGACTAYEGGEVCL